MPRHVNRDGQERPRRGRTRPTREPDDTRAWFRKIHHPKKRAFLQLFARSGQIGKAAKAARIHPTLPWVWRQTDPDFVEAFAIAKVLASEVIEDEILRRGVDGFVRPIFQGGRRVGEVREYSDQLLITAAKSTMPEKYRDRSEVKHDLSPALAALMPLWQQQRDEASRQGEEPREMLPAGAEDDWSDVMDGQLEAEPSGDDEDDEITPALDEDDA